MALQDPQAEPSMEEILASIRRIISEEEEEPQEPILDLTHSEPEVEDDIVVEADAEPEPAIEPEPRRRAVVAAEPHAMGEMADAILSPPTANAAAGALARLAGTLRIAETPGQTIEGVVRELLKPMLKEWLDRNLPAIVEARVEAELERIARMAR